ncbi:hypothetical protein KHC23_12910 [Ancylobacter dichloromethanicus]|uniref:HD domain-containing protein n=1 Tax=Ancylobacter dichloromethanicus TaxID=518825 RepID=A0A9W6MZ02_9HYPH|nr:hypothetical protein [Ancylobacter dichloromethanicus]MBS7554553.1 hypothetical protein [Ancylobacter dichloromethanicus]GLK71683.1 hypothetical protein GCM10017643_17980 [Ancylobacter dichloromethanicus]
MSLPPRVWLQSRNGRALDLVAPRPGQVDFAEIADQLALINRYVGASSVAVSVANHTLIAYRVACAVGATERERALVLLHDVHESRIGDKAPPVKAMEFAIAREMFGATAEDTLRQVMAEIERRHDAAIHAAALVDPPSEAEKAFVHRADLTALVTERRDFLSRPPMPWAPSIEAVPPLPTRQRLLPPARAAIELHELFIAHLPGARAQSFRAAPATRRSA